MINSEQKHTKNQLYSILFLASIIPLTLFLYWPGTHSEFLLDDIPNLEGLYENTEREESKYFEFIFSGTSGPTGRPLSLASFALNHYLGQTVQGYKITNIILHLVNAICIFWLFTLIFKDYLKDNNKTLILAMAATTLWLIHPLNVSTTLYTIQRMTQIATLMTLLGLISYVKLRIRYTGVERIRFTLLIASLMFFSTIAIFAKESGILLILFAAVLEFTLLSNTIPIKKGTQQKILFLFLISPLLLLGIYYFTYIFSFSTTPSYRGFNSWERLITENRVLVDYLRQILAPRYLTMSIFHDDYQASRSLIDPISTLFSVAFILALFISSIKLRRKYPIYSFAILWFLAAHVLESSVFQLELYFEHRNYLAILGPLVLFSYITIHSLHSTARKAGYFIFILFSLFIGHNTYELNKLWGNPPELAVIWNHFHPNSPRSIQYLAGKQLEMGYVEDAYNTIQKLEIVEPDHINTSLYRLLLACKLHTNIGNEDFNNQLKRLSGGRYQNFVPQLVKTLIDTRNHEKCDILRIENTNLILNALRANSNIKGDKGIRSFTWEAYAIALAHEDKVDIKQLITAVEKANDILTSIDRLSWLAKLYMNENMLDHATALLKQAYNQAQRARWWNKHKLNNIINLGDELGIEIEHGQQ